jgi:hypothetical protein
LGGLLLLLSGGQYVVVVVYGGGFFVVTVHGQSARNVSPESPDRNGVMSGLTGYGKSCGGGRGVSDVFESEGGGRLWRGEHMFSQDITAVGLFLTGQ